MMAKQVRPRQVKPYSHREQKAREADQAPASIFHQGHKVTYLGTKSGSMAAIFTCLISLIEGLAKQGGPSMCKNVVAQILMSRTVTPFSFLLA